MRSYTLSPLLLLATLIASCGGDNGPGYGAIATPGAEARDAGELDPAVCPPEAPVLGEAGATTLQTFELDWDSDGLDAYLPAYRHFVVPDDVRSFLIAVEQGNRFTAVNQLFLNGEPLIDLLDEVYAPPFFHEGVEVASVTLPINADTRPSGGCLTVDPIAYDTGADETGALHIVTRRDDATEVVFDLNLFVVGDTDITDEELAATIGRVEEVYLAAGAPGVGVVEVWELDWPDIYIDAEGRDIHELRATTVGDDSGRLNVFFVQDFTEVGTLGFAAGIPGPNGVPGTAASGVVISVDTHLDDDGFTLLTGLMGETLAHEIGHQIGLFHTTEAEGGNDPIADTPDCTLDQDRDGDGELTAEECVDLDGRNFMFWTAAEDFAQPELSPAQAAVLRDSVVARPQ